MVRAVKPITSIEDFLTKRQNFGFLRKSLHFLRKSIRKVFTYILEIGHWV